ncbi:MAG: M23 family metallopeptidase, partial [Candidatus Delongbacteria bacterium]
FIGGNILAGKGLIDALTAHEEIGLGHAFEISEALKYDVDYRFLAAGEDFIVEMDKKKEFVKSFSYIPNPVTTHKLKRNEDGFLEYELITRPTEKHYRYITGNIRTTLTEALEEKKIEPSVAATVYGILECIINFRYEARRGDTFSVFIEESYYKGEKLRGGRVLFASYNGKRTGRKVAYYFSDLDKNSAFNAHYTKDGEALIITALRYPVDRVHITSAFGKRIHPVTRKRSFHYGVDYRGAIGDPVYAVSGGIVTSTGYDGISGNKITLRHPDNTRTVYYHLNKIRVKRGQHVSARQRIGDIGRTGRVTGPHLHFGVMSAQGRWINPMNRRMIATRRLEGERYARYLVQMDIIDDMMSSHIRRQKMISEYPLHNIDNDGILDNLN